MSIRTTGILRLSVLRRSFAGLIAAAALVAGAGEEVGTVDVRAALADNDYAAAVRLADEAMRDPKQADEALYLKGLALHHANEHGDAITSLDRLITDHGESPWLRKARFLKVDALIKQRRFEQAEEILADEAIRLLSPQRKEELAGVFIRFADDLSTEPDPNDLAAPPANHAKAYTFYQQALQMEIARELRDDVLYKLALAAQRSENHSAAIMHLHAYLAAFDPAWSGPVGTLERMRGQLRQTPVEPGAHIFDARYHLGKSQLAVSQWHAARQNFQDLHAMLAGASAGELGHDIAAPEDVATRIANTSWQIVRSYHMPGVNSDELEKAVAAARTFLDTHRDHRHSIEAAWLIAQTYQNYGRADEAIAAYEAFISGENYELPEGEKASETIKRLGQSALQLQAQWRPQALYQVGALRYSQRKFDDAIAAWQRYVNRFPNGPHWAAAQRQIIDSQFMIALDLVADKKYDEARTKLAEFLAANPLDGRAPQVLFVLGQMEYSQEKWTSAIAEWDKLISKYPGTEESSLALYRTGLMYEEKLGDLEAALASYRKLTWGSYAQMARVRIAIMTDKQLEVKTERTFRTNETPQVRIAARNIEKVSVRQYFLDPQAYFRKTHTIGGVEELDIALIEPDKTWEIELDDYAKYKPLEQMIDVPFEDDTPAVCIVNISEDDWEATTLIVRSDIDLITRTSRREAIVFVQDMLTSAPAGDVSLLLSDGQKIFATGTTGADGVFHGSFDELKTLGGLSVFAVADGHIASNALSLEGLGLSQGLSPKGYIYTDRPAYQPGQTVSARGVIREVKDGSYALPADAVYAIAVLDAQGRLIREELQQLSEFGAFTTNFELDPAAAVGQYTITARPKGAATALYSGHFQVQQFQVQKMELAIDFQREVFFRGEIVEAAIKANYYWGEPVTGQAIHYQLPDGRQFTEHTDDTGELRISYDTSGAYPGSMLPFSATITGEDVHAGGMVYLPQFGFDMTIAPSQELALAGEPFDVNVTTTGPDGKPIGRNVSVIVLRREIVQADPVLAEVPWIGSAGDAWANVTVEEHNISTDAETGKGSLQLSLQGGGEYIIRAAGQDRFDQTVVTATSVRVSDKDDATRLRMFAESGSLKVGEDAVVRLHSRVEEGLALITVEGESVLDYRVMRINPGYNPIPLSVDHEHFPNFALSASVMDDRSLRTSTKPFEVERELKITVKPLEETYAPGETATVELIVTDQLGRPVQAELSLALVNEAILAQYPDQTPEILSFFQQGARRFVEFRAAATNGFAYQAQTRATIKAFNEESERLAEKASEQAQLAQLGEQLKRLQSAPKPAARASSAMRREMSEVQDMAGALVEMELDSREGVIVGGKMVRDRMDRSAGRGGGGGGRGGGALFSDDGADKQFNQPMNIALHHADGFALARELLSADTSIWGQPRRERPEAGWWDGAITTNAQGKASVVIPMPESTTRWQLMARGVTIETLAGQASGPVTTRKEFFIDVKAPRAAMEGDAVQVLARVHDLTDYEGPVSLEMTVASGDKTFTQLRKTITIEPGSTAQVLFDAFDVPAVGQLEITVKAATSQANDPGRGQPGARPGAGAGVLTDAVATTMLVEPYGIAYAAHGGGVATDSTRLLLELPDDQRYSSQWLTVSVGPDLRQQVIDMALSSHPIVRGADRAAKRGVIAPSSHRVYGQTAGGELLAAVSGIQYARATGGQQADQARLTQRALSLISALIVSQRDDGGWAWGRSDRTDFAITATSYWALASARGLGMTVSDDTMNKAQSLLNKLYQQAASADHEQKAIVLHALSVSGDADYKLANSLYRERNGLSPIAMAYTALALVNLDRDDMAGEVVVVLESIARSSRSAGRDLASWHENSRYHPWLNDRVETTAIALLALMRAKPASASVESAVQFLLQQYGCFGFTNGRSRGPGVAALAEYYAKGQFTDADFRLTITVNGTPVRAITADGDTQRAVFEVPADALKRGRNEVAFDMQGRGQYAFGATLRGFSSQFKDPGGFSSPYVHSRRYYHAPLEYRGVPLRVQSTSPVENLAVGQRTRVVVDTYNTGYAGHLVVEEPLPAGATLVPGSLSGGGFTHHEVRDGKIIMYLPLGRSLRDYSYELVGYSTGRYRALPTVIRDAFDPSKMRVHKPAEMVVLAPGEASTDPYIMNDGERFALGKAYFDDGLFGQSLGYLWPLFDRDRKYQEREVARMLLWCHTSEAHFNADRVVSAFELLSVRHPDLNIPFDRILRVGEAYRYIGEFERAWLVFRATIDSSFRNDSMISAVLEDEGQLLASFAFQENLWWEYPDTADVASSHFALAQTIYEESVNATALARADLGLVLPGVDDHDADNDGQPDKPITRVSMLIDAIEMLDEFAALYPENPLRDDAAFSKTGAYLDLKDYDTVVALSETYADKYSESDFVTSFQYMEALGWFWQRAYEPALASARVVADGESRDRDFARYMLGQIHHAQGQPGDAIQWYERVNTLYPDANEAIEYFREKKLSFDEINIFKPGEAVEVELDYRNISEADLQVYKVDLMKLYLREKNLSNITEVNLAGIAPQQVQSLKLGDGKDYADKKRTTSLELTDEGAYLVICRGDDLFASGLVLITPLEIEVQEEPASGRVRVNLRNAVDDLRPAEVHVKVVGSADAEFASGETDLRGIFVADGVNGTVTAIARDEQARYAFYRGSAWIGQREQLQQRGRAGIDQQNKNADVDYTNNLRQQQMELQRSNRAGFDMYRRSGTKGVEVKKAR